MANENSMTVDETAPTFDLVKKHPEGKPMKLPKNITIGTEGSLEGTQTFARYEEDQKTLYVYVNDPSGIGTTNRVTITLEEGFAVDNEGGSGLKEVTYTLDGGTALTYDYTPITLKTDGDSFVVTAIDNAGNSDSITVVTVIDDIAPSEVYFVLNPMGNPTPGWKYNSKNDLWYNMDYMICMEDNDGGSGPGLVEIGPGVEDVWYLRVRADGSVEKGSYRYLNNGTSKGGRGDEYWYGRDRVGNIGERVFYATPIATLVRNSTYTAVYSPDITGVAATLTAEDTLKLCGNVRADFTVTAGTLGINQYVMISDKLTVGGEAVLETPAAKGYIASTGMFRAMTENSQSFLSNVNVNDGAVILVDEEMTADEVAQFRTTYGLGENVTVRTLVAGLSVEPTETADDVTIVFTQDDSVESVDLSTAKQVIITNSSKNTEVRGDITTSVESESENSSIVLTNNGELAVTGKLSATAEKGSIEILNSADSVLNGGNDIHAAKAEAYDIKLKNNGHAVVAFTASNDIKVTNISSNTLKGSLTAERDITIGVGEQEATGAIRDASINASRVLSIASQDLDETVTLKGNFVVLEKDTISGVKITAVEALTLSDVEIDNEALLTADSITVFGKGNSFGEVEIGSITNTVTVSSDAVVDLSGRLTVHTRARIGNNGTINLKAGAELTGKVTNSGTLNWDLSVGAGNESTLAEWTKLTNNGTLAITLNAGDAKDSVYTLANNAASATGAVFELRGLGDDRSITVDGPSVVYNGLTYSLDTTATNDLVLSVVNAQILSDLTVYGGGDSEQRDLNDNWTNYANKSRISAKSFGTAAEGNTLDYIVSDKFVGIEQAKQFTEWTELTNHFVSLGGADEKTQFVYVRESNVETGEIASIKIYQLFADTVVPVSVEEVKGDADIETGWVNKYSSNAGVIYDAETGTYEGRTNNELAKMAGYKVNVIATDGDKGLASGIAVTDANGTVQKYWVSDKYDGQSAVDFADEAQGWTEYSQENPFTFTEEGRNVSDGYTIAVADKAGNVTTQAMSEIDIDWTDATIEKIIVNEKAQTGWYNKKTGTAIIAGLALDKLSGVDTVEYSVNGGAWQTASFEPIKEKIKGEIWTVTAGESATKDGDTYTFQVTDKAGNVSEAEYKLEDIKVDLSDPVISSALVVKTTVGKQTVGKFAPATKEYKPDGENGWYVSDVSYRVAFSDLVSGVEKFSYSTDGGQTWSEAVDVTGKSEYDFLILDTGAGEKTYTIKVTDVAGNFVTKTLDPIKVDKVDPLTNTVTATHTSQADAPAIESGKWITDMNLLAGEGAFDLKGTFDTPATDTGSALSVEIAYDVKYQKLELIEGERTWTGVTEATVKLVAGTDFTFDLDAGTWALTDAGKEKMFLPADSAGKYEFTVTVKDEAGNKKDTTFDVAFDNTQPLNPQVFLRQEKGLGFGEGTGTVPAIVTERNFQDASDLSIATADGVAAGEKQTETADVTGRYWATQTGALNLATLKFTEKLEDPSAPIASADFAKYWGEDAFTEGVMNEDAYVIAFYDQNSAGTYSTGATDEKELSNVRFVIDRTAPVADVTFAEEGKVVVDDVAWYKKADAGLTLTADDKWTKEAADYKDRVSGVAGFEYAIGEDEATQKAAGEEVTFTGEEFVAGRNDITFDAYDNAGNSTKDLGTTQTVSIGIDDAGPSYGMATLVMPGSPFQPAFGPAPMEAERALYTDKTNYVNAADAAKWFGKINVNNVHDYADEAKTADGVGVDYDVEKSYWTVTKTGEATGAKKAYTQGTTADSLTLALTEDGEYTLALDYTDKLGNEMTEQAYTIVRDTAAATVAVDTDLADSYTNGIKFTNGGSAAPVNEHKTVASELGGAAYATNDLKLTIDLADATSGLDKYELYTIDEAGEKNILAAESDLAGAKDKSFTLSSDDQFADYENAGTVSYTLKVTDLAGNVETKTFTYNYDTVATGEVTVKKNDGTVIAANADGKYYVNAKNYQIWYTQNDTDSGNGRVYYLDKDTDKWYDASMSDGTQHLAETGTDGSSFEHKAYISDKSGNLKDVGATVVVDTTKAAIKVKSTVNETVWQFPDEAPDKADAKKLDTTDLAEGKNLEGTFSSNWFSVLSGDLVVTVSDTNLASVVIDGMGMTFTGTSYDYTIRKQYLSQGANTHTITATDKAGNVTSSTITLNYDSVGPTIDAITIEGRAATSTATTVATAEKFYVASATAAYTVTATDLTSGVKDSYYTYSADGIDWSAWTTVTAAATLSGEGYYRFASADEAGNSTLSGYYQVIQDTKAPDQVKQLVRGQETPADGNYVEYTQKGQRINATDWVSAKDDGVELKVSFNNAAGMSAETHYVTTKFDIAAYNAALANGKTREEALAAGADGSWKPVGTTTGTGAGSALVWNETVKDHSTYYFYSKDEVGNVSEYSVNEVKIDNYAPVLERVKVDATAPGYAAFKMVATDLGGSGINADSFRIANNTEGEVTFLLGGDEVTLAAGQYTTYVSGMTVEIKKSSAAAQADTFTFSVNDNAGNNTTETAGVMSIEGATLDGEELNAYEIVWTDGRGLLKVSLEGASSANKLEYWDVDSEEFVECAKVYDAGGTVLVGFELPEGKYETLTLRATSGKTMATRTFKAGVDTTKPVVTDITVTPDETQLVTSVTVTASFEDIGVEGSGVYSRMYSLNNLDWYNYTDAGVTVTRNGTVYFRATDKAGNVSETVAKKISNIITGSSLTLDGNSATVSDGDYAFDNLILRNGASLAVVVDASITAEYVAIDAGTATIAGDNVITAKGKDSAGKSTKAKTSFAIADGATLNTTEAQLEAFEAYKKTDVDGSTVNVTGDGDAADLKWAVKNAVAALSFTGDVTAQTTTLSKSIDIAAASWNGIAGKADSITTSAKTDVTLETKIALGDKGDKIAVGSDAKFTMLGAVDFGADTDTLTIGSRSTAVFGDIANLEKLTVSAGKAATKAAEAVLTKVSVGSLGASDSLANTITLGNYSDVEVGSGVKFGAKADTLSLGNFAEATFDGDLSFGAGNDTLKVGSDSTFAAKSLDFGAGLDKFTVGARSTAKVGDITGLQTLTLAAGKASVTTKGKEADAVYTKLEAGDLTMLADKANAVTFNNYTDVNLGDVEMGALADKLTIGNNTGIDLGDVNLGAGNDAFKVGSMSTVTAKTVTFGDGKDTLSVGADSTLEIDKLDVANLETLTLGKNAELRLGDAQDVTDAQNKWSKYASQITLA